MAGVDTVVAPATPHGESALAVMRISGPEAGVLARAHRAGRDPLPRQVWHGDYRGLDGLPIDDVVFAFFKGPQSFTGDDVLEISCHGNPFIVAKILEDLRARGLRLAEPGEFTRRAFLNGRMDLTRAEAVMDVIRARSDRALEVAQRHLRGALGRRIEAAVARLLELCAGLEAYIDFPDEDLPAEDRAARIAALDGLIDEIGRLKASRRDGELLRNGARVLLLGPPNAGKSSIMNRLLGYDRAIVNEEPGTTRDFLEAEMLLGPHRIILVDTAGLREAPGGVERAGVAHTLALAETADFFIVVVDAGSPLPSLPEAALARLAPENAVVAVNKSDLSARECGPFRAGIREISVSAMTGAGFDDVRAHLVALVDARVGGGGDETHVAINARHGDALEEAFGCLDRARSLLRDAAPMELAGSELRGAVSALGAIVGRIDNERVLDALFASFCIGK